MPENKLEEYKRIVPFLGAALGRNVEVVLQDCRETSPDKRIVAIANGHVSGRVIGGSLTDYALRCIHEGVWKGADSETNYTARTSEGKILRSSTYFIKDNGTLIGMLCINVDTSAYQKLSADILRLIDLDFAPAQEAQARENLNNSFRDISREAIAETFHSYDVDLKKLEQNERIRYLETLQNKGAFLLKGAVPEAATLLNCSEASVYRYLSKINAKKQRVS